MTDAAFVGGQRLELAERVADRWNRPRAEGTVAIGSRRTQMRPPLTVRDRAEGFL